MKKRSKKSKKMLTTQFWDSVNVSLKALDQNTLDKIIDTIWDAHIAGKTIFFVGNGGSASIATHLAADLGKNTTRNHYDQLENRMKTMSLCDNVPWITAVSNDMSFDDIFVEQLKSYAMPGDLLVILSGSGKSTNIIKAALWAKDNKLNSIGILGFDGGYVKDFLDTSLVVEDSNYGVIESVHGCIHHFIVEVLKKRKKEQKT